MSNIVKFKDFSEEQAQAAKEEASADNEFRKLRLGDNILRFLPVLEDEPLTTPYITRWQHFVEVPGSLGKVVFNCPRLMNRMPCVACIHANELLRSGNPADRKEAEENWTASFGSLWRAVDRDQPQLGPGLFALSKNAHRDLSTLRSPRLGGNFTHPVEGFDVLITKTDVKGNIRYSVVATRDNTLLAQTEEEINNILESMPDLAKHLSMPTDAFLNEKLGVYLESMKKLSASPAPKVSLAAGTTNRAMATPVQRPVSPGMPVPAPRPRAAPPPPPARRTAQDLLGRQTGDEGPEDVSEEGD